MGNNPFLSVDNLVVEYTSEGQTIHAVNHVSFTLERGKTLGLVGETGAGKTTIAKSILRILPDPPAKIKDGAISLEGVNLLELPETAMYKIRGSRVSMVFQDPMTALNPVMRVGKQIAEVIQLHNNISKAEAVKRAEAMLEMVGIPTERYNEYPHQFSGGMKQRVVIAIALACSPELLIADEPTTALDVTIQAQVLEMISKLKQEKNMALILITHDLGVVAEVCDEVAVVYAGEIVEYGTKEDIFDHPAHPYTRGLFGALPDMDSDTDRLSPITGLPPNPSDLPKGCYFSPRCPLAEEKCLSAHFDLTEYQPGHTYRCWKQVTQEAPRGTVN
ncbi:ABC transporter ATP-binding protein [Breznakiella homolactica]|uniref:ABC transporter ATP-binding protein n=1 Tax=Breznakiella homolactica TaxID=2798577 RepID=A0A7T8B961_9SPIR|nr:ABC transporter ATP-binding protein [Breznakiella homolactica]QQO08117.1 ABC transporter ATP-binding protein [Breznakiella homolactica]